MNDSNDLELLRRCDAAVTEQTTAENDQLTAWQRATEQLFNDIQQYTGLSGVRGVAENCFIFNHAETMVFSDPSCSHELRCWAVPVGDLFNSRSTGRARIHVHPYSRATPSSCAAMASLYLVDVNKSTQLTLHDGRWVLVSDWIPFRRKLLTKSLLTRIIERESKRYTKSIR